jgi:hypothetical protein
MPLIAFFFVSIVIIRVDAPKPCQRIIFSNLVLAVVNGSFQPSIGLIDP